MRMPTDKMRLDDQTRRLHQALIDAVLETGRVPELSALTSQLDAPPDAIQEGL